MISCNSYQDILSPEEKEEKDRKFWERQRKKREKAEYLAECKEDEKD